MTPSTTLSADSLKMTSKVYYRRLHELINQLKGHPYCEEIMDLAFEQLQDDNDVVDSAYANTCTN
jgi:hypothetical protein